MVIVFRMAFRAIRGRVEKALTQVTTLAWNYSVQTNERKRGYVMVENNIVEPVFGPMTGAAICSQLTRVSVILAMAGDTICRERTRKRTVSVACGTIQLCVFAYQCKLGIPAMIETHLRPFSRSVTGLALFTQPAVVNVLNPMASNTGCRQVRINLANMTACTFQLSV